MSRYHSFEHPVEIEEGMVFAIETYWPSDDENSAARIEEEVHVTADGARLLTTLPGPGAPRHWHPLLERLLVRPRGERAPGSDPAGLARRAAERALRWRATPSRRRSSSAHCRSAATRSRPATGSRCAPRTRGRSWVVCRRSARPRPGARSTRPQRALADPLPAHRRAEILDGVAQALGRRHEEVARTISDEAGKPIKAARVEVTRAI